MRSRLPFFRDLDPGDPDVWLHRERDNLEAFVNRGGIVKVAFFGGLDTLRRVEDPWRAARSRVQVASLADLAGMKMRVIQVRATWKDYVDIHWKYMLVVTYVEGRHKRRSLMGRRETATRLVSLRTQ